MNDVRRVNINRFLGIWRTNMYLNEHLHRVRYRLTWKRASLEATNWINSR